MEYLLQRALELGAEKAKIIDTETVVVAEWVRWKCQYGCPLFAKDPFHPPFAPDAASTKRVLGEYTKAILLNGPNGQTLSEAAVKLEGEAYHRGYYKAFALVALVPSGWSACAPGRPLREPPDPAGRPRLRRSLHGWRRSNRKRQAPAAADPPARQRLRVSL